MSDTPDGLKKAFLKLLHSVGLHPFSRVLRREEDPPIRPALEHLGPSEAAPAEEEPPEGSGR